MAGFTNAYELAILGCILNGGTLQSPNPNWVIGELRQLGLLTAMGDSEGTDFTPAHAGTALPYNYGPQPPQGTAVQPLWVYDGLGVFRNSAQIVFSGYPACTVVGWYLLDTSTAGPNLKIIIKAPFPAPITIAAGGTLIIPANSLTVTLD